jgi:hypothetical protein
MCFFLSNMRLAATKKLVYISEKIRFFHGGITMSEKVIRNVVKLGRLHQTFSPSKKTQVYSIRRKICRSISPTKLKSTASVRILFARKIRAKMLINSTPGVNFTNILRVAFSYESFERSFFVLAVKVQLFIGPRILAQMCL